MFFIKDIAFSLPCFFHGSNSILWAIVLQKNGSLKRKIDDVAFHVCWIKNWDRDLGAATGWRVRCILALGALIGPQAAANGGSLLLRTWPGSRSSLCIWLGLPTNALQMFGFVWLSEKTSLRDNERRYQSSQNIDSVHSVVLGTASIQVEGRFRPPNGSKNV